MTQMIRANSMLNFLKSEIVNIDNRKDQLLFDFVNDANPSVESKDKVVASLKGEMDMIRKISDRYKFFDNSEFYLIFNAVECSLLELCY